MKLTKLLLTLGLAAVVLQSVASHPENMSTQISRRNPLLERSKLPFGAPDFTQIKETDY